MEAETVGPRVHFPRVGGREVIGVKSKIDVACSGITEPDLSLNTQFMCQACLHEEVIDVLFSIAIFPESICLIVKLAYAPGIPATQSGNNNLIAKGIILSRYPSGKEAGPVSDEKMGKLVKRDVYRACPCRDVRRILTEPRLDRISVD